MSGTAGGMHDMYAFVFVDTDTHTETLVGMRDGDYWQPLIASESESLPALRAIARRIGLEAHREVRLIHFTHREELPV